MRADDLFRIAYRAQDCQNLRFITKLLRDGAYDISCKKTRLGSRYQVYGRTGGYLLDNGHIAGSDTAEVLSKDEQVRKAYLGAA